MNINEETVDRIAKLCRLSFGVAEKKELCDGLNGMLGFVELLKTLDTSSASENSSSDNQNGVMREDNAETSLSRKKVLKSAPFSDDEAFLVPQTVSTEEDGV